MKWQDDIRNGKGRVTLSEQRIRALVARYRPRGWTIHEMPNTPYYDSLSHYPERLFEVPVLKCNYSLWSFFHEVGHVHRGHFTNFDCGDPGRSIPGHAEEYEAENYAYHIMLAEALPVTAAMIAGARWYVRLHIQHDKTLDISCLPYVERGMRRWRASS